MGSLRDIGYDLPSAVADLVDNSLDACAKHVRITVHADGPDSWIRIVDDGLGMTPRLLDEAMRYGSTRDYDERSLGHFGLGLKTGSLSQCRRLTVASRSGPSGRLGVRRWDLDLVEERDSWDLETPARPDVPRHLTEPLDARGGTVVLWEKLDRILAFRNPSGGHAQRSLEAMAREISSHLAMAFHRFLGGEAYGGGKAVRIEVNGRPVDPWDPFARDEPRTRELPAQSVELPLADGGVACLDVSPYVLPAQTQFSSSEAHQRAGGPNRWNRQQGFYIYRRERLIQSGGWNRLRTLDEHAKLARVALDLPVGREHVFGINVAKMSVALPDAVRAPLRAIASAVVQEAQRNYREHLTAESGDPGIRAGVSVDEGAPSISGDWPLILETVYDTLWARPADRDLLLLRLANAFAASPSSNPSDP